MDAFDAALAAIDQAHAADPQRVTTSDGADQAAEAKYCAHVMAWVDRLRPDGDQALRLAAAAQHLERWTLPRDEYPTGKAGYLAWRRAVHLRQGARARALIEAAGVAGAIAERAEQLIAKRTPRDDRDGQALEDATCLTFLELQAADFAATRSAESVIDILMKTMRKMSPAAHAAAAGLDVDPAVGAAIAAAAERLRIA